MHACSFAVEPPNTYRGPFRSGEGRGDQLGHLYAEKVEPAIDALAEGEEGLAAAAKAVFRFAREQNILEHVYTVGKYLRNGLEKLADRHTVIGNIQGLGLFICVDLVEDRATRVPATKLASLLPDAMKAEGVLIGLTGRYGNCLKFRPPLVFSKEDVDITLQTFDRVLTALESTFDNLA
ncbi:MAG: aminotransferase class III-fold pyridoxal phosphate-dependent enzyme [Pseudomonadales bacterium]